MTSFPSHVPALSHLSLYNLSRGIHISIDSKAVTIESTLAMAIVGHILLSSQRDFEHIWLLAGTSPPLNISYCLDSFTLSLLSHSELPIKSCFQDGKQARKRCPHLFQPPSFFTALMKPCEPSIHSVLYVHAYMRLVLPTSWFQWVLSSNKLLTCLWGQTQGSSVTDASASAFKQ